MRHFVRSAALAALLVPCLGGPWGQAADVLLNFDLTSVPSVAIPSGTATAVGFGLSADLLTRGTSLSGTNLARGFSANGWITGTDGIASSYENAVGYGQYFQFGLTVNPGSTASLQTLDLNLRRSAIASASNFVWHYSLDRFATPGVMITSTAVTVETGSAYYATGTFNYLGRNSGTAGTITPYQWMSASTAGQDNGNPLATLSLAAVPALQNLSGGATVQFRLYGWNNGGGAPTNTLAIARDQGPKITGLLSSPVSGTISWAGNGATLGGSGTWNAVAPTWYADGRNGPWATASHAAFGGTTSGTVLLRSSLVASSGMSFATDGYVIAQGGTVPVSLTLGGPPGGNAVSVGTGTARITVPLAGSGGLVKTGSGTLVIEGSTAPSGTTSVQGGVLAITQGAAFAAGKLVPASGGTVRFGAALQSTVGGLAPLAGGLTDVGSGMVTVAAGLSATSMVTAIMTGLGDGSWNGTSGITSSAAASSGGARTVGWLDNGGGSVTFGFAAAGDTNLDWQVDILDSANFLSSGKLDSGLPATWNEGDFTYDGFVDVLDAAAFLSTGLLDAGPYNPPAGTAGAVAAVPEPATPAIGLAVAAVALGVQRRRRRVG